MYSLEKTFLHLVHQIWPNDLTSQHIPCNNFSLRVELICTTMSNPRVDALLCFRLQSIVHNRWVNYLLFDTTIASSCTEIHTHTETPPYIPQRL